ncbi:hypothetical protein KIN20_010080 [Parelaphostrongylus tenuis]|uniref:Uncharacterized protein n=1 Tax=Parelaphostrongylus tenuis TaxID=148309 RepID=A0AAD5MTF7_PARTN|nr:hypothetical protein KIN20_010080 [Parelaphostrongylus tenuis]
MRNIQSKIVDERRLLSKEESGDFFKERAQASLDREFLRRHRRQLLIGMKHVVHD